MLEYFSKSYSYEDLRKRSANFNVFAGAKKIHFLEGKAKGVEAIEVNTGGGLRYTVLPDRGMDISFAEYKGIPLAYISQSGIVAPSYYNQDGEEWLRSFTGGLVTTCGLRQVGSPCRYNGEKHGLHGRISNLPAHHVCIWEEIVGDQYVISVKGKVAEARSCGENLLLMREIISFAGKNQIIIRDTIKNDGNTVQPFMILYHCNPGFPLLNDNAKIVIPNHGISSMYQGREAQMKRYEYVGAPTQDFDEDVFYFDVQADKNGIANVMVLNDRDDPQLALKISYSTDILDNLALWKQCSIGDYVVGIEPCNNYVKGLANTDKEGNMKYLQPGEEVKTGLTFEVFEGSEIVKGACEM